MSTKMLTSAFSEKRRKEYFFTDFLRISVLAFTYRKAKAFIKIQYIVKGNKNIFSMFFNHKIIATALLVVSDSLPLVQLKYSLNTVSSQPETNHVLNRLATSIS